MGVAFGKQWSKDGYRLIGKYRQRISILAMATIVRDNGVNMGKMRLDEFGLEFDGVLGLAVLHEDNVDNVITDVSFPFNLKSLTIHKREHSRRSLFIPNLFSSLQVFAR